MRQQTLQTRAETLRRIVEANRRCPRADWQVCQFTFAF